MKGKKRIGVKKRIKIYYVTGTNSLYECGHYAYLKYSDKINLKSKTYRYVSLEFIQK